MGDWLFHFHARRHWPGYCARVGLAFIAAVVAFTVTALIPPKYQATALITATQPRYELQFDARFRNISDSAIHPVPVPRLSGFDHWPSFAVPNAGY